jgi:hypothetical protein
MKFNLLQATADHMTRPRLGLPRTNFFYPSEASVEWIDQYGIKRVAGTCLRQSYFRLTKQVDAIPPDPYSEWIFALGKAVEEILVEQWKQMGIWVANNVKFFDPIHLISGEIDVVCTDPEGKPFGVEVKSFYGYHATKELCGAKGQEGRPKTSQLLQSLLYVDICKKHGVLEYFKMIYKARDSASEAEFDIDIIDDNGAKHPTINGNVDHRFTVNDIYSRYQKLQQYIDNKEVPNNDFEISWDLRKIDERRQIGEVSKTAYEKWEKNPKRDPIGDWQCRYCPFKKVCWS